MNTHFVMKKILIICFCILPFVACNHQNNQQAEKPNTDKEEKTISQEPTKKRIGSFTLEAELFHVIGHPDGSAIIKDAHRTETIELNEYDDGSLYMTGGDHIGGWVRYSELDGYEYECNDTHNNIYAFNAR